MPRLVSQGELHGVASFSLCQQAVSAARLGYLPPVNFNSLCSLRQLSASSLSGLSLGCLSQLSVGQQLVSTVCLQSVFAVLVVCLSWLFWSSICLGCQSANWLSQQVSWQAVSTVSALS